MGFSTKRGRPRRETSLASDSGTAELALKRALGLTADPLDTCLRKGLIDKDGHMAAIHLRWLYTLRFGAPGVSATDPLRLPGRDTREDYPLWRERREEEYSEAVSLLSTIGCESEVLDLCVLGRFPSFLLPPPLPRRAGNELESVKTGLGELAKLWFSASHPTENRLTNN